MSANEFKIIGKDLFESEKIAKPSMTFWQDVIRRIKMNKVATISVSQLITTITPL